MNIVDKNRSVSSIKHEDKRVAILAVGTGTWAKNRVTLTYVTRRSGYYVTIG